MHKYKTEEKVKVLKVFLERRIIHNADVEEFGRFANEWNNINSTCLGCMNLCKQHKDTTIISCKNFRKRRDD